ncbi:MAG: UvrD-helicase domain-containing protein [Brevundimonas sp.]|nr:UvrD-helicase domain-containing protein [Brevundimonas sp.]
MIYDDLTEQQRAFAEYPAEAFVQACPGAGKTRTLVERLNTLATSLPARHGVAILSFTNSAVEEFAHRCRGASIEASLRHPNFIGTFDAFLRRFIVLPAGSVEATVAPTVVDSWDTLDVEIRLQGRNAFAGQGLSLDYYDSDADEIMHERIRHTGLRRHVQQNLVDYTNVARARRRGLLRAGYLSAGDVRALARQKTADPAMGAALGSALAARFVEVIVDEAQDCNPQDLEIVAWLRLHGIRVTLVCDIDQSIYGFRHGLPNNLRNFAQVYPEDSQLLLTGNFRSSPAICSFAGTLRPEARVDDSLGPYARVEHPVLLIGYRGAAPSAAIGTTFIDRVRRLGLDVDDSVVLSHKKKSARSALGVQSADARGQSKIEWLAHAVGAFWSPASGARGREASLQSIEKLLLQCLGVRQDGEHPSRTITRLGLDRRLLRRQALEVATKLSPHCVNDAQARTEWVAQAREAFASICVAPVGQTIGRFLPSPPTGDWTKHLEGAGQEGQVAYATIHEAKGREFEAVCVVVPPNRAPENYTRQLMDAWTNRTDDEGKRVLYVGATRARQFLTVAVPAGLMPEVTRTLEAGAVAFERVDLP